MWFLIRIGCLACYVRILTGSCLLECFQGVRMAVSELFSVAILTFSVNMLPH